jgi:hypothetical protein
LEGIAHLPADAVEECRAKVWSRHAPLMARGTGVMCQLDRYVGKHDMGMVEIGMRKRHQNRSQANIADALDAAHRGDIEPLMRDRTEDWWNFVRERLDLGADQLMIRIENDDPAFGSWYLWLVFEVVDQHSGIALMRILIPDYEAKPDSALVIPQGYEQVPYFACRWES